MNEHPSAIKRITSSIFSLFNISRKIIVNLVFFFVLFLVLIGLFSEEEKVHIPNRAALVLDIYGDIVEQKLEIDPMEAFLSEAFNKPSTKPEVLLSDITDAIAMAKIDNRIQVLVLKLNYMRGAGLTKLRVLGQSIEDFKTSGKKVIAYGDQFLQDQYYLASYADQVWLNPNGWLLLDGYGSYQMYFKSAIEKLAISQHVFRVGTYKSAVEPYLRDSMSDEAKEANSEWLNDLWTQYKADVAQQRKFGIDNFDETSESLIKKLEQVDGKVAQYALQNHWIDALKTRDQINNDLIELVGTNKDNNYNQVNLRNYLKSEKTAFPYVDPTIDKIAIIVAKGTILDGKQDPGTIGGDSTASYLRKARLNSQVKAVVLRVDSPGGSAYASEIIRQEVELLKQAGKPVVASMGSLAASGGYWISASADKIVAAPTTITGSIGIFGLFMTFEETLSKVGVFTDGVGTTNLSGFGVTRPLSDGVSRILQLGIERGYKDFIELVAENRNMTFAEVDAVAQGRVWSGVKAKELGLVDELGDLDDAINIAGSLADLSHYETLLIEKEFSSQDMFLQNFFGKALSYMPVRNQTQLGAFDKFLLTLKNEYKMLNQLNDPQGIYSFCVACDAN